MDTRPVRELANYLATQRRVWVRLAAIRPDVDWQLSLLEVTVGEPPPTWRTRRWSYESAVFVASKPVGATVARWLTRGRIVLPSVSLGLALEGTAALERRDSRFVGVYERLSWPAREWSVHLRDSSGVTLHEELVAAGAPAFITFDQAAAAFFAVGLKPNRNFSGREVVVREQDRRGRIDRVLVRPTELVVAVSGGQLRGASLTLSGADGPSWSLSSRTRKLRVPTPAGLGAGAWLALHRDHELLDRRILDPAWGGRDFDVEVDPSTRVQVLISEGESVGVEFKRQLPGDPARVMKTVAAFANGSGGTLLFGVENDGRVVGLGAQYVHRSVDHLTNLIRDWVRPLPDFDAEMVDLAGRGLIALNVASSAHAPYGVGSDERDIRYYVRRAASTFPASPADVRAFVEARSAAMPAPYFPQGSR